MQIAITGATGFIGKRLVQYYENAGAVVHILSRKAPLNTRKMTHVFNLDLASCDPDGVLSMNAFILFTRCGEIGLIKIMRETRRFKMKPYQKMVLLILLLMTIAPDNRIYQTLYRLR